MAWIEVKTVLLKAKQRVELLEKAFYGSRHDRDRMAAVLEQAAEFILCEYEQGIPYDCSRLRHNELQRVSRHLRQYAHELKTADPHA